MTAPPRQLPVARLALAIYLASAVLFVPRLFLPGLSWDDFEYLRHSWTWSSAVEHLWVPFNEHAMPLARLSTWALARLAGSASALPWLLAWQGPVAAWLGMALVYFLLRRELDSPGAGLTGMALFGVSTQYFESVSWYAATFGLLSLDTFLLGLLAAQMYRQRGERRHLVGCALCCAFALGWYGGGLLAGPLCALYLLAPGPETRAQSGKSPRESLSRGLANAARALVDWVRGPGWVDQLLSLTPLLGTAAFLAISLPLTKSRIVHAEHFGGKSLWESVSLSTGLVNTGRSLVDNLTLGALGLPARATSEYTAWSPRPLPGWLALVLLPLVLAAAFLWWRRAVRRRLLLVGAAAILSNYLLIYSARAEWDYGVMCSWGRYQVFAHLGLVLFLAGGPPLWQAGLPSRRARLWRWGLALLLLTQFGRALEFHNSPRQLEQLRQVDAIDAVCRRQGISAEDARAALPFVPVVEGRPDENAWGFLRGSARPRELGETVDGRGRAVTWRYELRGEKWSRRCVDGRGRAITWEVKSVVLEAGGPDGAAVVTGKLVCTGRDVAEPGKGPGKERYDPPREATYRLRVVEGEDGAWLVDEVQGVE